MVFNIPWRYVAIGIVPAIAICAAMVPICSAAMGCNDFSKAKVGFRYATKLALGISLPLTVLTLPRQKKRSRSRGSRMGPSMMSPVRNA